MIVVEKGAGEIVDKALKDYENHFEQRFPLYEHLGKTRNEKYDISLSGAKSLTAFINKRITDDQPVRIPQGYAERVY